MFIIVGIERYLRKCVVQLLCLSPSNVENRLNTYVTYVKEKYVGKIIVLLTYKDLFLLIHDLCTFIENFLIHYTLTNRMTVNLDMLSTFIEGWVPTT